MVDNLFFEAAADFSLRICVFEKAGSDVFLRNIDGRTARPRMTLFYATLRTLFYLGDYTYPVTQGLWQAMIRTPINQSVYWNAHLVFFPPHWLISYIWVLWPMPFLRHVSRGNLAISKLLRKAEDRKLGFDNHSTTCSQQTMSSYGENPWIHPGWMAVVPHSSRLFWHEGAEPIEYLYSRFVH